MHAPSSRGSGLARDAHISACGTLNVDALQSFLRSELSAVETYELALDHVAHHGVREALRTMLASQAHRADELRGRIVCLGAEPVRGTGAWGTLAKALQAGADLLGDHVALAALEQGEDRGLTLYVNARHDVDSGTQKLIDGELLPAQRHTHDLCRTLKTFTKDAT